MVRRGVKKKNCFRLFGAFEVFLFVSRVRVVVWTKNKKKKKVGLVYQKRMRHSVNDF